MSHCGFSFNFLTCSTCSDECSNGLLYVRMYAEYTCICCGGSLSEITYEYECIDNVSNNVHNYV